MKCEKFMIHILIYFTARTLYEHIFSVSKSSSPHIPSPIKDNKLPIRGELFFNPAVLMDTKIFIKGLEQGSLLFFQDEKGARDCIAGRMTVSSVGWATNSQIKVRNFDFYLVTAFACGIAI